jgi:Uncharacterized protein conserved in bacteria
MTTSTLEDIYRNKYPYLQELALKIQTDLFNYLNGKVRIDRVSARAKSVPRFVEKANKKNKNGSIKYDNPLNQIQDQVGARIITYYLADVDEIACIVKKYYSFIEELDKRPDSITEFGYFGKHFILLIPDELKPKQEEVEIPTFFELQIKTLFQHAWGEAEHDLNYKTEEPLADDDKRMIAYSSAQAWGADQIFNTLYKKYNSES